MEVTRKSTVLLVDDEDMVLTSIRTLLLMEAEHEVRSFTDPARAVEYLETHSVELIVSDYMMPGMNGIQLLGHARRLQPEATRVLLTGHADSSSAIRAINEVGLFHYLEKPWDNAQLLLVIRQAVERAVLFRELKETIAALGSAQSMIKESQLRLLKAFL